MKITELTNEQLRKLTWELAYEEAESMSIREVAELIDIGPNATREELLEELKEFTEEEIKILLKK